LDSVRNLAATLGINSMTVSKAYALLEREGLVERHRGQQLVVAETKYTDQETSREAHVREALAPAVTVIRQLELPTGRAVGILREMLNEKVEEKSHEPHR